MTTNLFPFKVLFCFEDEFKVIVEIKRTDIQSEDKSSVYKWLIIQKQNENENENESKADFQSHWIKEERITAMTFQSMDQVDGDQIRKFAEGALTWNAENVSFNNEEMDRVDPELIHPKWLELINQFLV